MYDHYVRDEIGHRSIAAIKYSDIRKFYLSLIHDKGFKPNSMEIIHTVLHPVFETAVRDGMIRLNPTDGVMAEIKKSHNWEKPKRHALTEAQQTAFVDYIAGSRTYRHWLPLFTILLGTGCRVGEVIGLRWEDCDFPEGIISINLSSTGQWQGRISHYHAKDQGRRAYSTHAWRSQKCIASVAASANANRILQSRG